MAFFEFASIASFFSNLPWIELLIGGLCFALVFVFQGIALFTIASREGYSHKWMAFVPFFNTYYIGTCSQKNKFYNIDTKKVAISAAVFEAVMVALYVVYYVACYTIINSDVAPVIKESTFGLEEYSYPLDIVPSNLKWAAWMYNYMSEYILSVLDLVYLLLHIVLLVCFFQTYACRRYVLFTITSILFPIQGILFFVVRNNKGVNYKEFIARQQARQYQMYQQYHQQQQYYNQNPYSRNPYDNNQGAPYNGQHSQTKPDDPFEDFGGSSNGNNGGGNSGDSPFDEFD